MTRPTRRRDDLPPLHRAVSDTLDDHNHTQHGLTASWAHPVEFLDTLTEHGYTVIPTTLLNDIETAINDLAAACDAPTECGDPGCQELLARVQSAQARDAGWEASS